MTFQTNTWYSCIANKRAFWAWDKKSYANVKTDIYKTLIKKRFYDSHEIDIRLRFYWLLLIFWIISGGLLTPIFYLWILRGDLI